MSRQSWDVALGKRKSSSGEQMSLYFPVELGTALIEKGMFRATMTLTEDGILITPYEAEPRQGRKTLDLPKWGKK